MVTRRLSLFIGVVCLIGVSAWSGEAQAQGYCVYTVQGALRDCPFAAGEQVCVPCTGEPCDYICRLRQALGLVRPRLGRCEQNLRCIRRDCTLFLSADNPGGSCQVTVPRSRDA
jgi:hypothetical protein